VDVGRKLRLYQDVLGVAEYFLFDLFGDYLTPRLQGHRLRNGVYQRLPQRGTDGRLYSQQMQVELVPADQTLRLFDPRTQTWLLTEAETQAERANAAVQQALAEAVRANQAAARADAAEAEVLRLRAELARRPAAPAP
jgi:hypothetical protein